MSSHDTHHFSHADRARHPRSHPAVPSSLPPLHASCSCVDEEHMCSCTRGPLVGADDLHSRWVNSQVCPSFGVGGITSRWGCAWLAASRLMSFSSLTSAAAAAFRAKLETGTKSWRAFTRLIYIVPQQCNTIMPCQLHTNFG